MSDWPFDDAEDVVTLTVRQIVHEGKPILLVSHDADDGMWQFLTGEAVDMADAMLVGLGEVFRLDSSLAELADLPLGWQAARRSVGMPWERRKP